MKLKRDREFEATFKLCLAIIAGYSVIAIVVTEILLG
jgi:hypothetical protein